MGAVIRKDIRKRILILKKIFEESLDNKNFFELKDCMDFLRDCQTHNSIKEFEGLIIGIGKVKKDNQDFIRMILTFREGGKKIKNTRKVMDLIKDVEAALVYIDYINIDNQTEKDNVFLDVLKKI